MIHHQLLQLTLTAGPFTASRASLLGMLLHPPSVDRSLSHAYGLTRRFQQGIDFLLGQHFSASGSQPPVGLVIGDQNNGYAESFNSRVRDEPAGQRAVHVSCGGKDVEHAVAAGVQPPATAFEPGYVTPAAFAASLAQASVGAAPLPAPGRAKQKQVIFS